MGSSHSSLTSCIAPGEPRRRQLTDGRSRDGGPAAPFFSSLLSSERAISRAACRQMVLGLTHLASGASSLRLFRPWRRSAGGDADNRSWLLADSGAAAAEDAAIELRSVHSSFRFNISSPAEADGAAASASAVLLLVSSGDGGESEPRAPWQRLEFLERSVSPVAARLVRFSYRDIRLATRNFQKGRELGRGALSWVYRGRIGARRTVAIKRVEGKDPESAKAFCRELMIAGSLCNPNIVPLIGFCIDGEGLFLVYKFVSGGSLDHHLHHHERRGRRRAMPWEARYKVALGVAQAVEYLHYGNDKCVIHRDIKPSNILLSAKKNPKLCDFGMATWTHGPSLPFLCKSVKGTFGYLAPEYFQHGKLSDKTDVYAFGVVLLELITGRKAIDRSRPPGDENLVLWAKPLLLQGEIAMEKLVDPVLKLKPEHRQEMSRMVCAAAACISSEELGRPSIDRVIAMLQGDAICDDWSVFTGNGCLSGYGSCLHDQLDKSDMRSHIALAMLGVSDAEEDDMYGR